jgi:hypothetical protein
MKNVSYALTMHHTMKGYGELEVYFHAFLTSHWMEVSVQTQNQGSLWCKSSRYETAWTSEPVTMKMREYNSYTLLPRFSRWLVSKTSPPPPTNKKIRLIIEDPLKTSFSVFSASPPPWINTVMGPDSFLPVAPLTLRGMARKPVRAVN